MNTKADLDVQRQLQDELDSGEKIVWQGKGGTRFPPQAVLVFFFSLITLISVAFPLLTASHAPAHFSAPIMLFPFGLVAIVFVVVPLVAFLARGRTNYLLTNRRVLLVTLGRTKKVLSYSPSKLQSLERRERSGGKGDLIFDRIAATSGYQRNYGQQEIGFMNIPDVKKVETMLRELASGGRSN